MYYHDAQLGLPDKGCAFKGLVVCYVVGMGSMIYEMGQTGVLLFEHK